MKWTNKKKKKKEKPNSISQQKKFRAFFLFRKIETNVNDVMKECESKKKKMKKKTTHHHRFRMAFIRIMENFNLSEDFIEVFVGW